VITFHQVGIMHIRKVMSTVFSEEKDAIAEDDSAKLPPPLKTPESPMPDRSDNPLADYVLRVMREKNLTFPEVERLARRRGANIGKSTIQQIAQGKTPNPGIFTLQELAWGLGRPVEEIIAHTLATARGDSASIQQNELTNLWEMSKDLPVGEQRIFKRFVQMIEHEMQRILSSSD
jgi:transcriptional regulator with XRE-family HTH domain